MNAFSFLGSCFKFGYISFLIIFHDPLSKDLATCSEVSNALKMFFFFFFYSEKQNNHIVLHCGNIRSF